MVHDNQEAETISQTQLAENAANGFFDMADSLPIETDPKANEMFSSVGRETAQGNFDKAQRLLETDVVWDDNLRAAASQINQLDRERTGENPMAVEEVVEKIQGYAREFERISKEEGGRVADLESSMSFDNMASDLLESDINGVEAAIDYLEGALKSKNNVADKIPAGEKAAYLKDWHDKRAMRDTLVQEKQKLTEKQSQSEQELTSKNEESGVIVNNLKNLYAQTDVPENSPTRTVFLERVSKMPPAELTALKNDLTRVASEFGRSREPESLKSGLSDLVSRSYKLEDVVTRKEGEDEAKLAEIRNKINNPDEPTKEPSTPDLPSDGVALNRYYVNSFRQFQGITFQEFKQNFTPEVENKYKEWVQRYVEVLINEQPAGSRYGDTVASVLNNAPVIFKNLASINEGRNVDYDELLVMPFSDAVKKYLDIDVPANYFDHFSKR
jgi:hypothetical protein